MPNLYLPVGSFSDNCHFLPTIGPGNIIDSGLERVTLEGNHLILSLVVPDYDVSLI